MRIRKNMKLSSLLLATTGSVGEKPETYLCHFNQSPWDVIPVTSFGDGDCTVELSNILESSWFLPSPSSSSPPLIHKVEDGEDNVKMSLGNSNGATKRLNLNAAAEEDYESERSMDRSDNSDKNSESVEPDSPVSVPAPPKRGRPRGSGKKAPVSTAVTSSKGKKAPASAAVKNPYEFYYYSGFGPRWGRKRGGDNSIGMGENVRSKKTSNSGEDNEDGNGNGRTSSSFDGVNYGREECEVVVDQESDHGKEKMMKKPKRGRKPVKERSLKSLM